LFSVRPTALPHPAIYPFQKSFTISVAGRSCEQVPRMSAAFQRRSLSVDSIFFRTMPFIGIGGVYFCTVLEDRVVYFSEPTPVLGVA
jgi:hypothetical protein